MLTWSVFSRKTAWLWLHFTNAENHIPKISDSWNQWKFHEISSIRQLNITRNSGVLKKGLGQEVWKVWGLKPLSKKNARWFAKIRSGKRRSYPEIWTYWPNQVVPYQGRSTHDSAPPTKGTPPTPALNEIRRTRAEHLLQRHSENRHKKILFTDENFFYHRGAV